MLRLQYKSMNCDSSDSSRPVRMLVKARRVLRGGLLVLREAWLLTNAQLQDLMFPADSRRFTCQTNQNAENYNINQSIVITQIPRDLSEC